MSRVKACLNGSRAPGEHLALPVTADQLAAAARAVMAAGAFAAHVHPRRADARETLDPGPCGEAVAAIRRACPGLPVGLSTGAWIEPDAAGRLELIESWTPRPDFVSVNLHEVGAARLVRDVSSLGIGVEAGVWTAADATLLDVEGLARHCLRVLIEPQAREPVAALATASAIDRVLDAAGITLPRVYHGYDASAWPMIEAAVQRGRDTRVGFEDVLTLPDGRPARDNAELVAAALALVARGGEPSGSPDRSTPGTSRSSHP